MNALFRFPEVCLLTVILLATGGRATAADERTEADKATIARGFELAHKFCGRCHGGATSQHDQQQGIDPDQELLIKNHSHLC